MLLSLLRWFVFVLFIGLLLAYRKGWFKSKPLSDFAAVFSIISGVITAFLFIFQPSPPPPPPTPIPTPTATTQPTPFSDTKFGVIVAQIEGDDMAVLYKALLNYLEYHHSSAGHVDIEVRGLDQPIADQRAADDLADRTGAKIVIWGRYVQSPSEGLALHFTHRQKWRRLDTTVTRWLNPELIASPGVDEAIDYTRFVVLVIQGIDAYYGSRPKAALRALETARNVASASSNIVIKNIDLLPLCILEGHIYLSLENFTAAENAFSLAQSSSDSEVKYHSIIGKGSFLYSQGDLEAANMLFMEAETIKPLSPSSIYYQANIAYLKGDLLGAKSLYQESIEIYPDFSQGWYQLAWTNHHLGNTLAAREAIARVSIADAEPLFATQVAVAGTVIARPTETSTLQVPVTLPHSTTTQTLATRTPGMTTLTPTPTPAVRAKPTSVTPELPVPTPTVSATPFVELLEPSSGTKFGYTTFGWQSSGLGEGQAFELQVRSKDSGTWRTLGTTKDQHYDVGKGAGLQTTWYYWRIAVVSQWAAEPVVLSREDWEFKFTGPPSPEIPTPIYSLPTRPVPTPIPYPW